MFGTRAIASSFIFRDKHLIVRIIIENMSIAGEICSSAFITWTNVATRSSNIVELVKNIYILQIYTYIQRSYCNDQRQVLISFFFSVLISANPKACK